MHGLSVGSLATALTEGSAQSISREFAGIVNNIRQKSQGELTGTDRAFNVDEVGNTLTGTDKAYEQQVSPLNQLSGKDKAYIQENSNVNLSGKDNAFN